jgi:hypothetical protein
VTESPSFSTRLWFAFACFFKVLFDAGFAARAWSVREDLPALPAPAPKQKPKAEKRDLSPAVQLLALFQREGRLVDFLQQDVSGFGDQDIGAAARAVHEGCRKALRAHAQVSAVRSEEEGASITLQSGFDASRVKLSGNVAGSAPYRGTLRHKGWQLEKLDLPQLVEGHDAMLIAPAEVEVA